MIPQIDKEIGISVYTTKSLPVNGKIKQSETDFSVSEVLSEKALSTFDNLKVMLYTYSQNLELILIIHYYDIKKRYGLVLKSLGLKDANATTEAICLHS